MPLAQDVCDFRAVSRKVRAETELLRKQNAKLGDAVRGKRSLSMRESARVKTLSQKMVSINSMVAASLMKCENWR